MTREQMAEGQRRAERFAQRESGPATSTEGRTCMAPHSLQAASGNFRNAGSLSDAVRGLG